MEAGKRRLAGDTARAATSGEVQDLRHESRVLKDCVDDQPREQVAQKKHDRGLGRRRMRYPAPEKLEIIRIVEQSHLSTKMTLDKLVVARRTCARDSTAKPKYCSPATEYQLLPEVWLQVGTFR